MPRAKWRVNDENFYDVMDYVERNKPALFLRISRTKEAEKLNAIIEDELCVREISTMRSSIRMNRSRAKKEVKQMKDVNITITAEAHALIVSLCARDGLNISDSLVRNLEMLMEMPDKTRNDLINKWT